MERDVGSRVAPDGDAVGGFLHLKEYDDNEFDSSMNTDLATELELETHISLGRNGTELFLMDSLSDFGSIVDFSVLDHQFMRLRNALDSIPEVPTMETETKSYAE